MSLFRSLSTLNYFKKYLAEHEPDIIIHKAAKQHFNEMGLKKLTSVKSLNAEFQDLLTQKKTAYANTPKRKKSSGSC